MRGPASAEPARTRPGASTTSSVRSSQTSAGGRGRRSPKTSKPPQRSSSRASARMERRALSHSSAGGRSDEASSSEESDETPSSDGSEESDHDQPIVLPETFDDDASRTETEDEQAEGHEGADAHVTDEPSSRQSRRRSKGKKRSTAKPRYSPTVSGEYREIESGLFLGQRKRKPRTVLSPVSRPQRARKGSSKTVKSAQKVTKANPPRKRQKKK